MAQPIYTTIDEYLAVCDPEVRPVLQELRSVIHKNAPEASEKISWNMPTFFMNENLVHFFAHKNHIGFYPGESGISHFSDRFKEMKLKFSKGAVQLPLSKPMPYDLIAEITQFRVSESMEKKAKKELKKRGLKHGS